jgi:hypothetical protein
LPEHARFYLRAASVTVNLNASAIGAVNATCGTSLTAPVDLGPANALARVAR